MKLNAFSLLLLLTLVSSASSQNDPRNYRCWPDLGVDGVIKIDFANGLVCQTGFDGTDYGCPNQHPLTPKRMMTIRNVTQETKLFFGDQVAVQTVTASTDDNLNHATLAVYDQEFPRPYFPQLNHMVRPADIEVDTYYFAYPTYHWIRKPDGKFENEDFYCLSEKYFP